MRFLRMELARDSIADGADELDDGGEKSHDGIGDNVTRQIFTHRSRAFLATEADRVSHVHSGRMQWGSSHSESHYSKYIQVGLQATFEDIAERMGILASRAEQPSNQESARRQSSWGLRTPQVILWVTGQTSGELILEPGLDYALKNGLKRIAGSPLDTWVITGGMEGGVMAYVGEAISSHVGTATPCIGIVYKQKVTGRFEVAKLRQDDDDDEDDAQIDMCYHATLSTSSEGGNAIWRRSSEWGVSSSVRVSAGETSRLQREDRAEETKALEPHHTHFILVDNEGAERDENGFCQWGGEIETANMVRSELNRRYHCPLAVLVIGGTIGTLSDILDALDSNGRAAVVVVRGSGGCAEVLSRFLDRMATREQQLQEEDVLQRLADGRNTHATASAEELNTGKDVHEELDKLTTEMALDRLLFAGELDLNEKKRKRKHAQHLLSSIYYHRRRQKRLHLYNHHDAYDANMELGYALLSAIVGSMELDAEMSREQKSNSHSAVAHMLCDPHPQMRRACLSDQCIYTKYPLRCKPWEHEDFAGVLAERYMPHVLDFQFPTAKERYELTRMPLGLTWVQLPSTERPNGTEIIRSPLSHALAQRRLKKVTFSADEARHFGMTPHELQHDAFVTVPWSEDEVRYFRPADPIGMRFDYQPEDYTDPAIFNATAEEAEQQKATLGLRWREVAPTGLMWRKLGGSAPEGAHRRLLRNGALEQALTAEDRVVPLGRVPPGDAPFVGKEFVREEWQAFGIAGLLSTDYAFSGSAYFEAIVEPPASGKPLNAHDDGVLALEAALQRRGTAQVEFTAAEWQSFGLAATSLRCDDYVTVGATYFELDLPRNPHGRTGLQGRGKLSCWGANHCVDYIITRSLHDRDVTTDEGPRAHIIDDITKRGRLSRRALVATRWRAKESFVGLKTMDAHGAVITEDDALQVHVGKATDGKEFETDEMEWTCQSESSVECRPLPAGSRHRRAFLGTIRYTTRSETPVRTSARKSAMSRPGTSGVGNGGSSDGDVSSGDTVSGALRTDDALQTATRTENGLFFFDVTALDRTVHITHLLGASFQVAGLKVYCTMSPHEGQENHAKSWQLATSPLEPLPSGGGALATPIVVKAGRTVGIMIACSSQHSSRGVLLASDDVEKYDHDLATLGLTWYDVGETRPTTGSEFQSPDLETALGAAGKPRVEFTQADLANFGVDAKRLRLDSYIKTGGDTPLGLRWRCIGASRPAEGVELHHCKRLRRLLRKHYEFTVEQLPELGLPEGGVEEGTFVNVATTRSPIFFQVAPPRERFFKPDYKFIKSEFLAEQRSCFRCGIPGGAPALGSGAPPESFIFGWKLYALKSYVEQRVRSNATEGASIIHAKLERIEALWNHMKDHSQVLHSGYVEDMRNTDNAWFEAKVYHMQMDRLEHLSFRLRVDAPEWNPVDEFDNIPKDCHDTNSGKVCNLLWLEMNRLTEPRYETLFPTHRKHLDRLDKEFLPHHRAGMQYEDLAQGVLAVRMPWHKVDESTYRPVSTPASDTKVDTKNAAMADMASTDPLALDSRGTYEFVTPVARGHLPRNPWGSTGFSGRGTDGLFLKYGVNMSVDMIITRQDPNTDEWQMVVFKDQTGPRANNFRLPGAMFKTKSDFAVGATGLMYETMLQHMRGECRCQPNVVAWETGYGPSPREYELANSVPSHSDQQVNEESSRWAGAAAFSFTRASRTTRRARQHETQHRMDRLLVDLFQHPTELYRGYVDDWRNTDNAWIETICNGFHCTAELGSLLSFPVYGEYGFKELREPELRRELEAKRELGHPGVSEALGARALVTPRFEAIHLSREEFDAFAIKEAELDGVYVRARPSARHAWRYYMPTRSHIMWLPIKLVSKVRWFASHERLATGAVANLQRQIGKKMIGMLEIVVGFGRKELINRVLLAPKLQEERSTLKLQRALSDALVRAASSTTFDLGIIEALLGAGGKVSDLTLKDLFADPRAHMMDSIKHVLALRANQTHGNKRVHVEGTPWAEDIADALDDLLPGFSLYADRRDETHEAVTEFDLMCWALCCGADELALFMWRRTSSPIRAALIGQQLCSRILATEFGLDHLMRENLIAASAAFNEASLALVSLIDKDPRHRNNHWDVVVKLIYPDVRMKEDDEDEATAEDELVGESLTATLRRHGTDDLGLIAPSFTNGLHRRIAEGIGRQFPDAFRGAARRGWKVKPHRLLDLAIHLQNQQFVSHPSCVRLVFELWRGKRLKGKHRMPEFQRHNNLFEFLRLFIDPVLRGVPEFVRGESDFVTTSWRIPLMKRWHHSLSHVAFFIFLVWYSFMPLCGDLPVMFWFYVIWIASLCWQEVLQFQRSPSVAIEDWFNFVDWFMCAALVSTVLLRWKLQYPSISQEPVEVPVQDYITQLDRERWMRGLPPLRPGGRLRDDPLYVQPDMKACPPWTGDQEALRTLLALAIIMQTFRLLEVFSSNQDLARIWFTLIRIYGNDLFLMVSLMFILMSGFGFAFGLLVPSFSLANTDGPIYLLRDADVWLDVGAGSAIWQAMYAVFGDFDIAELTSAAGTAVMTPLIFYTYLFFVTMPIVNLLIAMFSESYEKITDDIARERWHLRDAQACIRFLKMYSPVPAPLNILAELRLVERVFFRPIFSRLGMGRGRPLSKASRYERRVLWRNAQAATDATLELAARDRYLEVMQSAEKREVGHQLHTLELSLRKSDRLLEDKLREKSTSAESTLLRELKESMKAAIEPLAARVDALSAAATLPTGHRASLHRRSGVNAGVLEASPSRERAGPLTIRRHSFEQASSPAPRVHPSPAPRLHPSVASALDTINDSLEHIYQNFDPPSHASSPTAQFESASLSAASPSAVELEAQDEDRELTI